MDKNTALLKATPGLSEVIDEIASESYLARHLKDYNMSLSLRGSRHVVDLCQRDQYIAFLREDHRWRDDGKGGTEWTMLFGLYDCATGTVVSRSEVVRSWKHQELDRRKHWWNSISIEYLGERVQKRIGCGAWHLGGTPYEETIKENVAVLVLESADSTSKVALDLQKPVCLSRRRLSWEEYRHLEAGAT